MLFPFCPFCLLPYLPFLCPETHSLQACLSLCQSRNRVLSISIALDIRRFLLILQLLSSNLFFACLPHGNLGEPNTKHTLRSPRIWCCPVATTLSSKLTALCLLSYPSFLLLWLLFACCGLRIFFSIGFCAHVCFCCLPQSWEYTHCYMSVPAWQTVHEVSSDWAFAIPVIVAPWGAGGFSAAANGKGETDCRACLWHR